MGNKIENVRMKENVHTVHILLLRKNLFILLFFLSKLRTVGPNLMAKATHFHSRYDFDTFATFSSSEVW
jgi:hypothetical protein